MYLGNVASSARVRDIEKFFKSYGRLRDVAIKNGFAFVEFEGARAAAAAIREMDGHSLCGKRISVRPYRSRDFRGGDRGGSRRGTAPDPRTNYRIIVENISRRTTDWRVGISVYPTFYTYQYQLLDQNC